MEKIINLIQILIAVSIWVVWVGRFDNIVKEFEHFGYPVWFRSLVGAVKISLAALLVAGIWFPSLVFYSAASMAMQSMIGLICDPVANRVEVPCLGKNVMAASNALSCANMALAGYDPVIPLDEVIETAKQVAKQMPREVRCTNLGGLSITPTAIALEEKLAARRASSCGTACHCG
jgi:L-serine dehydratase